MLIPHYGGNTNVGEIGINNSTGMNDLGEGREKGKLNPWGLASPTRHSKKQTSYPTCSFAYRLWVNCERLTLGYQRGEFA